MCAIAGLVDLTPDENTLEKMIRSMRHRGPDGQGIAKEAGCILLHTRLAIIDPKGGGQPMELAWGEEKYIISYNGEIYNSADVRDVLQKHGHLFCSHSDTEIVLHAYAQWGEECLQKLNGIFAFAVWECKAERLFLARDRIGVKPLFYTTCGKGLIFASEIKTILCHSAIKAELDLQGAAQVVLLGPGRIPGSGVFHNVCEIEPGCCGFFRNGRLITRRYWKLTDQTNQDTFDEAKEKVRFLVIDSIKRQMISDVPIGTFLSGGLDSSIISAVCSEEEMKQGRKLKTFSVDYENNDFYFIPGKFQPTSDNSFIELMIQAISTEHFWTRLTPEDLSEHLEEATQARDLPGMADVDFSLLAFCKHIRQEVKVALSGECADEIFGGYPWYRDPEIRTQEGFPWAQTTKQRSELMTPSLAKLSDPESFVMDEYQKTCLESDILPGTCPLEKRMKEMVNLNFRWFMQTLLDRKDRMSMKCGLEVRVPFCDYRIAEYLYTVPWEYKDYKGKEKGLLRAAMEGILPEEVLYRKKSPYPKTYDPRYEQIMEHRLNTIMCDRQSPLFYLLCRDRITDFLSHEYEWPWYGQLMKRPQTIAYFVQMDYWLRNYNIDFLF